MLEVSDVKYAIGTELWREAQKAHDWYNATGMRVAKTPAIPRDVAAWILRKCEAPAPTGVPVENDDSCYDCGRSGHRYCGRD